MVDLLLKPEIIALLALWLPALVGACTYFVQKKVDTRNQIQETRRKEYVIYFTSIAEKFHYQTIRAGSPESQAEYTRKHIEALGNMRKAYFSILVISSDRVCSQIAEFQKCISAEGDERDAAKFADAFASLMEAVRTEGYGKSKLTRAEILAIVNAKV